MQNPEYSYAKKQEGRTTMKHLTGSVYSFEKLRNEDYLYVDKTEFI